MEWIITWNYLRTAKPRAISSPDYCRISTADINQRVNRSAGRNIDDVADKDTKGALV